MGTVYRIAHGYEPRDKCIRKALGFPVLAKVPVCQKCGDVHLAKRCTAPRQQESYEEWKARNADTLAAMVAWAEQPRATRQKWSKK